MIDRVTTGLGRRLIEVPVGLQVVRRTGCSTGRSASAARRAPARRSCASTARPGPRTRTASCSGLLAAEITATLGIDPGARYLELTREFGTPVYERIDAPATVDQKRLLATALRRVGRRERAGGRSDPRDHHDRARQRGIHRRAESDHGRGMVCRASVRHGGRVQALRRELPRPRASRADPDRGAGARHQTLRAGIHMTLGYTSPLYLLPFDHRHSYVTGMFEFTTPLTADEHDSRRREQAGDL